MSPYLFGILIHHYVSPCRYERDDADGYRAAISDFIAAGMIELRPEDERDYGSKYRTTRKAEFWINYVLATPYPVSEWKIPERTP